jgi:hypothetical protein
MMRQVQEEVAGDLFRIIIHQLRDHAFIINTGQSETVGKSCLRDSYIFDKDIEIDFLISTPKNEIERMINKVKSKKKRVKKLKKMIDQKGKYSNDPPLVSFNSLSFTHIHHATFGNLHLKFLMLKLRKIHSVDELGEFSDNPTLGWLYSIDAIISFPA